MRYLTSIEDRQKGTKGMDYTRQAKEVLKIAEKSAEGDKHTLM